ncbi:MAG: substrate-binding domain-containing protein [Spirochaetales bacterium]|nr:substrate-binding domain-containing protein [Spirochaetales bacterium]
MSIKKKICINPSFIVYVFLFCIFMVLFIASDVECESTDKPKLTIDTYPRVCNTGATAPLGAIIACELIGMPWQWEKFFTGTTMVIPQVDSIENEEERNRFSNLYYEKISHSDTHYAYTGLARKEFDLILVGGKPTRDELLLAETEDVVFDIQAVALDSLVFIVNIENPLQNITIRQIQDIYSGEITDWAELGFEPAKINAYISGENSDDHAYMVRSVMKGKKMMHGLPRLVLIAMIGPLNMLEQDVRGIGYSAFYFEEYLTQNKMIKRIAVNGVIPDRDSIRNRTYPLIRQLYIVVRSDMPQESAAYKIKEWLLSDQGQRLIEANGYLPLKSF